MAKTPRKRASKSSPTRLANLAAKVAAAEQENLTLRELRQQVGTLEKRLRKVRSGQEVVFDAVTQVLGEGLPAIEVPPAPSKRRGRAKHRPEIAVLHLSDTQIGKTTPSYDTAVAEARILAACRKACLIADIRRVHTPINEIRLYLGGDMVEGEDIFPHQAHTIDSPLIEQACLVGPRIFVKAVLILLESFATVRIRTVPGNHGRNGPRGTRSHPRTNWDQVLYHTLRIMLLGPDEAPRNEMRKRVDMPWNEDFYVVDRVFDWGNLMVHGHQISGGFAGFPWYGAGKKAWGWIDSIPESWDNLFFGHFHTPAMFTLGHRRVYANGTTESDNEFAKEQLAACGVPTQRLCFQNAKVGIVSDDLLELVPRVPTSTRGW